MEDIVLSRVLDDSRTLYISPIDRATYEEHIEDDGLGGNNGYFVMLSRRGGIPRIEVLAKAATLEAAAALFDLIVMGRDEPHLSRSDYSTVLFL